MWEGEIQGAGSKVIIRAIPTITIGDYGIGGTINYQDLTDDKIELLIDKAKYQLARLVDYIKIICRSSVLSLSNQCA